MPARRWYFLVHVVKRMQCQADLLEVVLAVRPPNRFASGLNCWQQQADERADDSDHHQQLN